MSFRNAIQFYILDCCWVFFTKKVFKQRTWIFHGIFCFLCEKSGPFLRRQHTIWEIIFCFESRVIMWLQRLKCGNILCIGDVYWIVKNTICVIVKKNCKLEQVWKNMFQHSQMNSYKLKIEILWCPKTLKQGGSNLSKVLLL